MSGYDTLRDLIVAAAYDVTDDDTPSETVTYTPKVGDARTIQAIPHREEPEKWGGTKKSSIRVMVPNSVADGISSTELVIGADTITIAVRHGGTPVAKNIYKILGQNAAFLSLGLE